MSDFEIANEHKVNTFLRGKKDELSKGDVSLDCIMIARTLELKGEVIGFDSKLMPGGTAEKYMLDSDFRFDLASQLRIGLDMLTGVDNLHEMNIAHCDLHLENILIDTDGDSLKGAKVTDFGKSRMLNEEFTKKVAMHCFAPRPPQEGVRGTKEHDAFSAGICLYQLMTKQSQRRLRALTHMVDKNDKPQDENTELLHMDDQVAKDKHNKDSKCELWPKWGEIPPEIQTIIKGLVRTNPKDRLSIKEAKTQLASFYNKQAISS